MDNERRSCEMRYSLIVWDFDGTLADTLASGLEICNKLARRHGYATIEGLHTLKDMTASQFLQAFEVPRRRLLAHRREFLAEQKASIHRAPLYEGVPEVLEQCRRLGVRMGVFSTNSEGNIRICLCAHRVDQYFDFVVGCSRLFSKPRQLKRLLRRLAVDPRRVLYVGDEVRDIEAARYAGTDIAAGTWGINSRRLLAAHSPTHLVDGPRQVLELVLPATNEVAFERRCIRASSVGLPAQDARSSSVGRLAGRGASMLSIRHPACGRED